MALCISTCCCDLLPLFMARSGVRLGDAVLLGEDVVLGEEMVLVGWVKRAVGGEK